jgi:AcrR family transcriptional regulator
VTTASSPGRPRDPELERRALRAARLLYAEQGRRGVTFHQVALRSGVGKPALYRRWESADDLLVDALSEITFPVIAADQGDVAAELAAFAEATMTMLLAPEGAAVIRAMTEFHAQPELFARWMANVDTHVVAGTHAIILRGIARGDLPKSTSAEVVAAAVAGGAVVEVLTRLQAGRQPDADGIRAFCEQLARFAVAGAKAGF